MTVTARILPICLVAALASCRGEPAEDDGGPDGPDADTGADAAADGALDGGEDDAPEADAPPTSQLFLNWRFDDSGTCADANVDNIHVVLYRDGTTVAYDRADLDCDEGSVLILDLYGVFDVRVRGTDATSGAYTVEYNEDGLEILTGEPEGVIANLHRCPGGCQAP